MRYFGLSVGLEQEQTVAEQNEDKVEEVLDVDGVDNLETELLEVADSDAEGAAREEAIDEASEVIDSMEDDVEDLKTAQESGGIDQFAASILVRGVNHRLASIGMPAIVLPAQESFGSVSDRQAATSIAIEAISDKVREAWQAIINAIKRAAKWIKGHFVKVFGGFERLKKRAAAVAEKAEKASGTAKEKSFENDGLFNKLKVNKNVSVNEIENTFGIVEAVLKKTGDVKSKTAQLVTDVEKYADDASQRPTTGLDVLVSALSGDQAKDQNVHTKNQVANAGNFQTSEMAGGMVILTSHGTDTTNGFNAFRVNLVAKDPNASRVEGRRINVLGLTDASKLASRMEVIADIGVANRKVMDELADEKERLAKAVERVSKREDKTDNDGNIDVEGTSNQRSNDRNVRAEIMAIDRLVGNFPAKFNSYVLATAKAVLDYCELSIRQYSQD